MLWTITLIFFVGALLGYAAGYKSGWNAHVDYKLDETISRATEQAEHERR